MRILYWQPNCGSGIEQIGYVFAWMLYRLGHTVDVFVTQDVKTQKQTSKYAQQYDALVLNEPHKDIFNRMQAHTFKNTWAIIHANPDVAPKYVKCLSLNYPYHAWFNKNANLLFPLNYPFAYNRNIYKCNTGKRTYKRGFIGRFIPEKFDPAFCELLKQTNEKLDYIVTDTPECAKDYAVEVFSSSILINKIYDMLYNTELLIHPSTQECINLVAGEALTCGCDVVAYDNRSNVYAQFRNHVIPATNAHTMWSYIHQTYKAKVGGNTTAQAFMWEHFSLPRTQAQLAQYFGVSGNAPRMTFHVHPEDKLINLPFENALVITNCVEVKYDIVQF